MNNQDERRQRERILKDLVKIAQFINSN